MCKALNQFRIENITGSLFKELSRDSDWVKMAPSHLEVGSYRTVQASGRLQVTCGN